MSSAVFEQKRTNRLKTKFDTAGDSGVASIVHLSNSNEHPHPILTLFAPFNTATSLKMSVSPHQL